MRRNASVSVQGDVQEVSRYLKVVCVFVRRVKIAGREQVLTLWNADVCQISERNDGTTPYLNIKLANAIKLFMKDKRKDSITLREYLKVFNLHKSLEEEKNVLYSSFAKS